MLLPFTKTLTVRSEKQREPQHRPKKKGQRALELSLCECVWASLNVAFARRDKVASDASIG